MSMGGKRAEICDTFMFIMNKYVVHELSLVALSVFYAGGGFISNKLSVHNIMLIQNDKRRTTNVEKKLKHTNTHTHTHTERAEKAQSSITRFLAGKSKAEKRKAREKINECKLGYGRKASGGGE